MPCTCRARLAHAADGLLGEAEKAREPWASNLRGRAMAYAVASGYLKGDETMTALTSVQPDIDRDRYGRPMVFLPGAKKPTAYTRCTTYISCLEDTYNLSRWQQRMVALGLAERPDLLLSVAAHREDKDHLNRICEDALEAAKGHAAATTGTAVHALTEILDRGLDLPVIPDGAGKDLDAYREATAGFEWLAIEQFCVLDDLKIGGTPDRVVRLPDGCTVIADLKTGSIEFGIAKIAMQLAVYSRSLAYDHKTHERSALPDVDQNVGLVIHLPAGQGACALVEVDIAAGWDAVDLATKVRAHRSRKGWAKPYNPVDLAAISEGGPRVKIAEIIGCCDSEAELIATWQRFEAWWTDEHTALATARKAALRQSA